MCRRLKDRQIARRAIAEALRPVVEGLEGRQLLSSDPLQYAGVVQTLPYALDFTRQVNGVPDASGQMTGFTRLQVNTAGDQYQPSLIHLNTTAGELDLTSKGTNTTGSNYGTSNSLNNALETQFNATTRGFTITARIKGPLTQFTAGYDQAAIYFGPDQDNYVKLGAGYDTAQGQALQFTDEQNANTHTVNSYKSVGSLSSLSSLDLRLTGDASTGTVTASYALNGGAFAGIPGALTLSGTEEAAFFNAAGRAGIFVATRNSLPPITVGFNHFEIDAGTPVAPPAQAPSVAIIRPAANDTNVSRDAFVSVDFNLPNGSIDGTTLNTGDVYLYRTSDHALIPSIVNTSGGGDAVVCQPRVLLDANTSYTFVITGGLKDVTRTSVTPFQMSFTTGTAGGTTDPSIAFEQISLPTAANADFTCVRVGPDHLLYASTEDGRIFRWSMNADGTLGTAQIITSLQTFNHAVRLITGFAFDPSSTATNVILWVDNGFYSGGVPWYTDNAPDFTGKVTVMSGPNLSVVQDAVINLPRSIRDHSTEQPIFGPDGALYFCQGSNTSYGAPDQIWGMRPEHLLNAAILRLDITKVTPGNPLDVKTPDAGGTYNPYAPGAPLTIYATGVRNAFQLFFADDGTLYAPSNGSAAGGNAPGFPNNVNGNRIDTSQPYNGPAVPALNTLPFSEEDWLFKIQQGGYYGHPDPARGEYVLDGGNPTAGVDPAEVPQYPVGTQPDPNYRGFVFDFGPHRSPDGMIEYHGSAFGGQLDGKWLVAEYSGGSDIAVLSHDASGNITSIERGISGLTDLNNPVNLAEDPTTGFIYVAEIGGRNITLLRPVPAGSQLTASKTVMAFNGVQTTSGGGPSPTQTLTITNTGTVPLTFPSDGFTVLDDPSVPGDDTTAFAITNRVSLPNIVQPGQSVAVQISFTAPSLGIHAAILRLKSNDPTHPVTDIMLHGIGTAGQFGYLEPSLVQILRAYNIPTIVGAGPNDVNASNSQYPVNPDPSSQEVVLQRLVKAGSGPVTVSLLGTFDTGTQPALRFGYYTPGDPTDLSELFSINRADAQTVNPTPQGATSFDPGTSSFGLYASFPGISTSNGQPDVHYSEDALNVLDPAHPRKFRFFPLENPDGSVVPNAYVVAAEDYNSPTYNSFTNLVAIIRNVKAAPGGPAAPVLGLENLDQVPFTDRLVFSRLQFVNPLVNDVVHDTATLRIHNTGGTPLVINSATLSDTTNWVIVNPPAFPVTVAANGGILDLTIKFIATAAPVHSDNQTNDTTTSEGIPVTQAGGVWNATLTLASNDPSNATRSIQLAGYWQHRSESEEEPGLNTISTLLFGYQTVISNPARPNLPEGTTAVYYGEEVPSAFWNAADPTLPVSVRQLDGFHSQLYQGAVTSAFLYWYKQGTTANNLVISQAYGQGQTVLPRKVNSTLPAAGSFTPNATFGWLIDNNNSDDTKNTSGAGAGHHVRFYPVRDRSGNLVPNTWLMAVDYVAVNYENFDFQDNVYLVSNMRPATEAPAPTDAYAVASPAGGVSIQWAAVSMPGATYNVYRASSPGGTYVKLTGQPIAQASYSDASAPGGAMSYYRITAINPTTGVESMATNASALASGSVVTGPATPVNLTANATGAGIALQWSANTDNNLAGYNVYRGTSAGGPFTLLNPQILTSPSFNDTSAPSGIASFYQVVAVDALGNASAPATISATRPAVAPAAPTSLAAQANSPSQVTLSWVASSGTVTAYHVERNAGNGFVEIAPNVQGTTFIDTTAQPNTTYTYQVRAESSGLFSGYSNTSQVTTPQPVHNDPFTSQDIGAAQPGTTTMVTPGVDYNIVGGGPAIYGTADGFRFAYQQVTSDFDVKVQLQALSISTGGRLPQAGLMARETLDPASRDVFIGATTTSGYRFKYRTAPGGATTGITVGAPLMPNAYVRLVRAGSIFTAYYSTDGTNWTMYSAVNLPLASTVYLGLAATADSTTTLTTVQFRGYGPTPQATQPPGAPASLSASAVSPGEVDLSWTSAAGAASYRVERASSGGSFVEIASNVIGTAYADRAVQPATAYQYRVRAQNSAGNGSYSPVASATTPQLQNDPYTSQDIGASLPGSTAMITPGANYDVTAGGPAIYGNADGFRFVYQQLTGDFDVKVRINSISVAGNIDQAGLMARATLDAGAINAYVSASPNQGFRFKYRSALNGATTPANTVGTCTYPNVWVRLQRTGSTVTGYYGTDGISWTSAGTVALSLPNTIYVGMATSANTATATTTAQYRSYGPAQAGPSLPGAPSSLAATPTSSGPINLSWSAASGATSYHVQRKGPTDTDYVDIAPSVSGTTYADTSVQPGTSYSYRILSQNAVGVATSFSPIATATTPTAASAYSSVDIGATPAGTTSVVTEGSAYDVTAGGADIGAGSDSFRFLYKQITGDFDARVQVQSLGYITSATKAGLMVRTDLTAAAAMVFSGATPANYRLMTRSTPGAVATLAKAGACTFPTCWVRLVRSGDTFTGYLSTDGINWTITGTASLTLPTTLYFGLAVAAHSTTATTTAQLKNLSVT